MTEARLAPEEVRTRTFPRVVRGYRRRQVRRLLERAATDLARLRNGPPGTGPDDPPPLTPEEIEEARFQPALGGYEMNEVDQFLDRLVVELERAAREPSRAPSALPAPPSSFSRPSSGRPPSAQPPPRPQAGPPPTVHPAPRPTVPQQSLVSGLPSAPTAPPQGPAAPPTPGPVAPPRGPAAPPTPGPAPPAQDPAPPPQGPAPPPQGPGAPAGPLPRSAGSRPAPAEPAPPPTRPSAATADEALFPPPSVPPSSAPAPFPPAPPEAPGQAAAAPPPMSARPLTPSEVETHTFDRGAPGYLPAHVDLFLARAARALAGREEDEALTRWDVLRQRFPLGPRGYATSEVDAFLVRLAAQFPEPDPDSQQEILRKLQGG